MAGDLAAVVADHDLARADPGADAQPDQRDRDRVAVLPDRDQRLRVDARAMRAPRVELARPAARRSSGRSRSSASPTVSARPAIRRAEVGEAAVLEQLVELRERRDLGDRHEMAAAEAADLALDAALLMRALRCPDA